MTEPSKLAEALAKAQGEMKNAVLNKINPHFKSKYADLAAVREATLPALNKHGLSLTQCTVMRDGALILLTILWHQSGEQITSEYPLPNEPNKPQIMGSATTYARRYCWAAMCGIASDEDDDAEAAHTNGNGAKVEPKPKEHGEARGPLGLVELKDKLKDFAHDLEACEDADMLHGLLSKSKPILEQCKRDLPSWWATKPNSDVKGFDDRIRDRMTDLAKAERAMA